MHPVKVLHFIILPSITYPCKYLANQFLLLDQFRASYQQIFTFASLAKTFPNMGMKRLVLHLFACFCKGGNACADSCRC